MDDLQRIIYRHLFRIAFLENKGASFETMFSRIMAHAHPGDFEPVRPYGKLGDLKCDGYRASDKTVFQCYGPSTHTLDKLLAKMRRDFTGAVEHWGPRMERWSLVHNADDGLPAPATQLLADFRRDHPTLDLGQMAWAELFDIVMGLTILQLEDLFGSVPSQRTMTALDFEALRPVINSIQRMEPNNDPPLTAPSPTKISANDLSDDAAGMLRQGRRREPLVKDFFGRYPDPSFAEEIAQGFRDRYAALRRDGVTAWRPRQSSWRCRISRAACPALRQGRPLCSQ
ncbi:ABC-three component system protein [uncultured Erythrobacter sp.]|uniref:ABC-three component system protein n=1 Tax=uncultured Erythrobacter sp. TaxID=263913 RepID=UPI002634A597|nr:ABC-three component system protein [uncultured Erythrobacter sp.]